MSVAGLLPAVLGGARAMAAPLHALGALPLLSCAVAGCGARYFAATAAALHAGLGPTPPPEGMVSVKINGKVTHVDARATVLDAAGQNHIYIPSLCKHPRLPTAPGTCRLCLVEVDGRMRPACVTPVSEGMVVDTTSEEVRRNVVGVLSLMRANHPEDCMTCDVNGKCEFQDLITKYKVPRYDKLTDASADYMHHHELWHAKDNSSMAISIDKDKCVKCGRCVTACGEVQNMNVLGMFARGRDRHVGFLADNGEEGEMDWSKCIECGQCASVCPVGAIVEREEWREVLELLQEGKKVMVVQTAPAVRVAIGEEIGLAPGAIETGQMVAGLRRLGFNYVFDTDFSADLTIMEEGTELLQRLGHVWAHPEGTPQVSTQQADGHGDQHAPGPLPMFTSCCPAWVNLVEKSYPELAPHLSTAKSPQQMFGAVVKTYWAQKAGVKPEDICLVSVMPCTAKKHEAERPEMASDGLRHVDYVITTRELGKMFRHQRIPVASLPAEDYDKPLGVSSSAGALFGNTGGVMEAAVRTVYEVVTGKELPGRMVLSPVRGLQGIKQARLVLQPKDGAQPREVRVAVASGIANARKLVEQIRSGEVAYDFVEVMTCPGGCIGGGGQPKTKDPLAIPKRLDAIYDIDERATLRKSHENPDIQVMYKEFLGAPCSETSHRLLHTTYSDRSKVTVPAYTVEEKAEAAVPLPLAPCDLLERQARLVQALQGVPPPQQQQQQQRQLAPIR